MPSSSGWMRVALGFRMVAGAAATRLAEESSHIASRAVVHGADILTRGGAPKDVWQKFTHKAPSTPTTPAPTATVTATVTTQFSPTLPTHDNPALETADPSISTTFTDHPLATTESHHLNAHAVEIESITESAESAESVTNVITNTIATDDMSQPSEGRLKGGQPVPATRFGRAVGFANLGLGLAFGTVGELSSRLFSGSNSKSIVGTDANADRLAATLCRMRGAALKMGQMLSIQDESLLPPALTRALAQVRQGADAMPQYQLLQQLESQLGPDWRSKFLTFDEHPLAAASIGQVHKATIMVGTNVIKDVVVKVQYPGVAKSIDSDLNNLTMLVKWTGLAPKGLFLDNVVRVGRDELKVECDYLQEKNHQRRFKALVQSDPVLTTERFVVPDVFDDFTTSQIITSEFCLGGTIDKAINLSQEERNRIGTTILYLTIQELFVWRFMQTDPNWGNFLYDMGSRTTSLIDFGATREYSKSFVDGYLRIVCANANRDGATLMELSHKMNFLTGNENDIMREAHKNSGFTVGEPFALADEPFNFRDSNISSRLGEHTSAFMQHRLTPPPEEVYTLHRKLAGAYMLCIKLGASVDCRTLLRNVVEKHVFDDEMEPPKL